jgi:hypothetical protein
MIAEEGRVVEADRRRRVGLDTLAVEVRKVSCKSSQFMDWGKRRVSGAFGNNTA